MIRPARVGVFAVVAVEVGTIEVGTIEAGSVEAGSVEVGSVEVEMAVQVAEFEAQVYLQV